MSARQSPVVHVGWLYRDVGGRETVLLREEFSPHRQAAPTQLRGLGRLVREVWGSAEVFA